MEETKKVQVHPSDENVQTEIWQNFGWTLVSSQEINNTDSHLERKGDTIYNVTTKENYVNLLFKRDTNMPHYSEIVALERQFDAIPSNTYPKLSKAVLIVCGFIGIGGISAPFQEGTDIVTILGCLAVGVIAIAGGILYFISNKKKRIAANEQNEKNNSERIRIRRAARELL